METCLNNLGIVEHHERTCGQIVGQMEKVVGSYFAMPIDKQLAVVALGEWKLGNALIGELILIIFYS